MSQHGDLIVNPAIWLKKHLYVCDYGWLDREGASDLYLLYNAGHVGIVGSCFQRLVAAEAPPSKVRQGASLLLLLLLGRKEAL